MSWDDPVTKFLPYFELKIDTDNSEATVTIRDLLAHRTGFTGMNPLWAGGAVSREEVLRTVTLRRAVVALPREVLLQQRRLPRRRNGIERRGGFFLG